MDISIVALDALPVLDSTVREGIGGVEVRAITFARGLRDEHQVAPKVIVKDRHGLPEELEGFPIQGYHKPRTNLVAKLSQSLAKRVAKRPPLNPFFQRLQTDIVLCFGVRNDTASIVRSCKRSGKRSVVFLTSDRNIQDACRHGKHDRGAYGEIGYLCRYALSESDLVIAQTPYQRDALQEQLGISAKLIRNPIDLNRRGEQAADTPNNVPKALWVGRADTFSKRADLCISLAERCPKLPFRMVMNNHQAEVFSQLRAIAPANVKIVEQVPYSEIEDLFFDSRVLLNTSAAEGFPNSFLQAAKYGKPIVSLDVDPGGMLDTHGCGVCAGGNLEDMAEIVETLFANHAYYSQISKRCLHYVQEFHAAKSRCKDLFDALNRLTPYELRSVA